MYKTILRTRISTKIFIITTIALFAILGAVYAFTYSEIHQLYEVYAIRKNNNTNLVKPDEEIKIKFNQPIKQSKAEQTFSIEPKIDGQISWLRNYPMGYAKTIIFKPNQYFDENKTYTIKIGEIESLFGTKLKNRTYTFTTVKPFSIIQTLPQDNQKDVVVNPEFKVIANGIGDYFDFDFSLDPKTDLEILEKKQEHDQTIYSLKNKTQLGQGINYTWKIKEIYTPSKKTVETYTYHFATLSPIEVSNIMPSNQDQNVNINRKIQISFNKPVNHEQVEKNLEITPETKGTTEWKGDTLVFTPQDKLTKNTEYTIRIMSGIQSSIDQSFLEGDRVYTFKTKDSDLYPPIPTWEPKYKEGKYIHINLANQTLYAYENGELIDSFLISSVVAGFPTPIGDFQIFSKARAARMTGFYGPGNPNNYDLPGVPYVLSFYGPYTIHGTYWHNNFGHPMSHGCVNMYTPDAEWLYNWAAISTPTIVE